MYKQLFAVSARIALATLALTVFTILPAGAQTSVIDSARNSMFYGGLPLASPASPPVKSKGNRAIHYRIHTGSPGEINTPPSGDGTPLEQLGFQPRLSASEPSLPLVDSAPVQTFNIEISDLIEKGFYSSDFLAYAPFVAASAAELARCYPPGIVLKKDKRNHTGVYMPFDEVVFTGDNRRSFAAGDTVDILGAYGAMFSEKKTRVTVLRRVGWGNVAKTENKIITVRLEKVWDVIPGNARLVAHTTVSSREVDTIVPSERAVSGHVICQVASAVIPTLYEMVIGDVGSNDGAALGDVFSVYPKEDAALQHPAAMAYVINVRESFCTLAIVKMFAPASTVRGTMILRMQTKFK